MTVGAGDNRRRCTWRRVCGARAVARVERRSMLGVAFLEDVCGGHLASAEAIGYRITDTYAALPHAEQRERAALADEEARARLYELAEKYEVPLPPPR